jgi:hypothetical protein
MGAGLEFDSSGESRRLEVGGRAGRSPLMEAPPLL